MVLQGGKLNYEIDQKDPISCEQNLFDNWHFLWNMIVLHYQQNVIDIRLKITPKSS